MSFTPIGRVGTAAALAVDAVVVEDATDVLCNSLAGLSSTSQLEDTLAEVVENDECFVVAGDLKTTYTPAWVTTDLSSTDAPYYCGD